MRRLLTSAVAAAMFVAASGGEANAQDMMGRRMSLFDIGVYGGWSGTTKWATDASGKDITIGSNPVFGLISNYWFTPRIGVRAHGGYIPAAIGVKDDFDFPGFFSNPEDNRRNVNVWLYDLNLVFRPWIETNPGLLGGMYLFLGGGGLTANLAGNNDVGLGDGTVAMSGSPSYSTVGQGNAGLGFDIISLTDNIGAFIEAGVHGYSPPTWVGGAAEEPGLAYTGRVVAGLKLAFGDIAPLPPPPPPAPEPLPPPPPPAPTTREITVCVVQDGALQNVTATFNPATGDTMVMQAGTERPFAEAYPATMGYSAGATWYVNDEPIRLNNRNYVKFGLTRVIDAGQLTRTTDYQGVPVFTETGAATPPEVIYVPVRPGCEFQPYQLQTQIRVRG